MPSGYRQPSLGPARVVIGAFVLAAGVINLSAATWGFSTPTMTESGEKAGSLKWPADALPRPIPVDMPPANVLNPRAWREWLTNFPASDCSLVRQHYVSRSKTEGLSWLNCLDSRIDCQPEYLRTAITRYHDLCGGALLQVLP